MSFWPDDLRPGPSDPEPDRDALLTTVLEAVAFCVYDNQKVTEIFEQIRVRVWDKHHIRLNPSVQWNAPTVHIGQDLKSIFPHNN